MSSFKPGKRYWAFNSRSKMDALSIKPKSGGFFRPGRRIPRDTIKYMYGKSNK